MSDQHENDGPYQDAQSAEELERYVMSSTFPKTPAEWWARGEIESLRARIAELEVLLKDCADELEARLDEDYKRRTGIVLPEYRLKYERDMAPVVAARAALKREK